MSVLRQEPHDEAGQDGAVTAATAAPSFNDQTERAGLSSSCGGGQLDRKKPNPKGFTRDLASARVVKNGVGKDSEPVSLDDRGHLADAPVVQGLPCSSQRQVNSWSRCAHIVVKYAVKAVLVSAYFVYLTLALAWNFNRALPVLCLTLLVVWRVTWRRVSGTDVISQLRHKVVHSAESFSLKVLGRRPVRLACYGVTTCIMLGYCVLVNIKTPENLLSLVGVAVLMLFCWLISYDRDNISLRPVIWGLAAQMFLGVLVLKTSAGALAFQWLGREVEGFLGYVTAGVTFVFGEKYEDFYFAFRLMPTTLFVSSVMAILYYVGIMQTVVNVISTVMKVTMGTTAPETVSTAASIFLGQPQASFTITPYLRTMSNSELHAIMTAGFASVSADIFGLFVNYGVSSAHILTAVLMSAPAGLAVSKIVCPMSPPCDSQIPTRPILAEASSAGHHPEKEGPQNIIDAAGRGAQDAVVIVLAVGATLIAFLSILAFLNAAVTYLGSLVHIPDLTIELALSYPLMPLSYVMGVPWGDCRIVGEVVALKTVLNEFVGYERLGKYIHSKSLSKRSQVIATYALCGFSNPTTVGVTLGGLSALVPSRRRDLASLVISAWVSGCVACFLTACFAGIFFEDDSLSDAYFPNNTTITTGVSL